MKNNRMILFTIIIIVQALLVQRCESVASVSMASNFACTIGTACTLQCNAFNMVANDIVWQVICPPGSTANTIYVTSAIQAGYLGGNYNANATTSTPNAASYFTINSLTSGDASCVYQCSCYAYSSNCVSPFPAANATITASNSVTCSGTAYSTATYTLILLTYLILVVSALLLYFSFKERTVLKTFFLILTLVLSFFFIVVMIVFWIGPTLANQTWVASIIIVAFGLGACAIVWALIIIYAIMLWKDKDYKLLVLILIIVLAVLSVLCAVLIIFAVLACTGQTSLTNITGFSYSILEIIGAALLVVFALLLILITGIMFYILKMRNREKSLFHFRPLSGESSKTKTQKVSPETTGGPLKNHKPATSTIHHMLWLPSRAPTSTEPLYYNDPTRVSMVREPTRTIIDRHATTTRATSPGKPMSSLPRYRANNKVTSDQGTSMMDYDGRPKTPLYTIQPHQYATQSPQKQPYNRSGRLLRTPKTGVEAIWNVDELPDHANDGFGPDRIHRKPIRATLGGKQDRPRASDTNPYY